LDDPGRERTGRGEESDRLHADPELIDDLEEYQGQDDGLGVVDRVGDGQQAERAHRVDVRGDHPPIVPHRRPLASGPDRPM